MRAIVYRMTVGNKSVSHTVDFALGDTDPGENQVLSNLLAAALDAGLDPKAEDLKTFRKIEVE